MTLIYGCIAPHAGDLIPETSPYPSPITQTRETLRAMGERLQALAPEVVVIINPHGFRVIDAMSISIAEKAAAVWSPEVVLDFDLDQALATTIAGQAMEMGVPVARYIYGASAGPSCSIPLDWGAAVPLYFLGHQFQPRPRLVHISPMKALGYQLHYDFGRAIGSVIRSSQQRVAFIASADQAHAHNAQGPYGFDPAAACYDAWMQAVIREERLDDLLNADPGLVENAKPDSLWPTLILAGVLRENPMRGRLLSYEVHGYFGILCAEYELLPAA